MRALALCLLSVLLAACDGQAAEDLPVPEPSPLDGAWTLPFSLGRVESVGVRFANVEIYDLSVVGGEARAGRRLSVSACDGRGGCSPLCQSPAPTAYGTAEGRRVQFHPVPVVAWGPSEPVGEATLSAELTDDDSLRVRLVVRSPDPDCAFEGDAVLARAASR